MRYIVLLFILLLPYSNIAQPALTGLGKYTLGHTTPDSLNASEFSELDQAYVKGTIALPCTHIRTFKAVKAKIDGVDSNNLLLFFYDNQLFKISCDHSDALRQAFIKKQGKGKAVDKSRFTFCPQNTAQFMTLWGEIWQSGDRQALAVRGTGYNADCQLVEINQLIIKAQQIVDLASDCELPTTSIYAEEFDKAVNDR